MSEPESFLARWNRRKQAAKHDGSVEPEPPAQRGAVRADRVPAEDTEAPGPAAGPGDGGDSSPASPNAGESRERSASSEAVAFDVSRLPSIDSITEHSDVRAFLAPGVPANLARAALRRAWSADPAIRDFVGLAENQWDFTAPDEVPGFGPLQGNEQIARLVAKVFGEHPSADGAVPDELSPSVQAPGQNERASAPDTASVRDDPEPKVAGESILQSNANAIATQYSDKPDEDLPSVRPRGHGSALPR